MILLWSTCLLSCLWWANYSPSFPRFLDLPCSTKITKFVTLPNFYHIYFYKSCHTPPDPCNPQTKDLFDVWINKTTTAETVTASGSSFIIQLKRIHRMHFLLISIISMNVVQNLYELILCRFTLKIFHNRLDEILRKVKLYWLWLISYPS